MRVIPYDFLWFNIEEISKSSSPLIVDYIFNESCRGRLDSIVLKYEYKVIHVHFDADTEIAHKRFNARNKNNEDEGKIRPREISLEDFASGVQANKNFRYNDTFIYVDTSDFSTVSYDDIYDKIKQRVN